jgi:hypothetical protein
MALAPLANLHPEPPFNDVPVTGNMRFSLPWMRYFTMLSDWMRGVEARVPATRLDTMEARIAALQARLDAAGIP